MRKTNPINALFPKVRQNILAATLLQPEKWWFISELADYLGTSPSSLQRELESLTMSGILQSRRDGNRLYFQAETDSPIFAPLQELMDQTIGIIEQIKELITGFSEKINIGFIYGSVARGEENTQSDVDVILIGNVKLSEISTLLRDLERKFNREINVNCYSLEEFQNKIHAENHFLTSVISGKKIFLLGNENVLEQIISQ